jgi:hypothetical protein
VLSVRFSTQGYTYENQGLKIKSKVSLFEEEMKGVFIISKRVGYETNL